MKDLKNIPAIGDEVMVWPAQRTVRDEKKQPVIGSDGKVQTIAARVRDVRGTLITSSPIPVRVNAYYYKLLVNGNLDWSTKEKYQTDLVAKAKAKVADAAALKAASDTKQPAPEAAATSADAAASKEAANQETQPASPTAQTESSAQLETAATSAPAADHAQLDEPQPASHE